MEDRRLSCLSASLRTSGGGAALSRAARTSSSSSAPSSSSPSSRRMAFICSRRKKSFWALSMPSLAVAWMRACMAATSTSLASWSLISLSRSMGSSVSRMRWASATFMRRLEAMRSARRPGSDTPPSTERISGEATPRRARMRSLCSRALRMSASFSGSGGSDSRALRSGMISMRAVWCGPSGTNWRTRARATPCTRTLRRPSGILSMRMMRPTVPVVYNSSGPGSSVFSSFWARTRMWRSEARAASTAATDLSRPTNRGRIM